MTGVQTCALPICFPVTIGDLGGFTQPMVFDFSNGREIVLPKDFYYMVGSIIEDDTTRYTVEEAEELATRNGHYGPW